MTHQPAYTSVIAVYLISSIQKKKQEFSHDSSYHRSPEHFANDIVLSSNSFPSANTATPTHPNSSFRYTHHQPLRAPLQPAKYSWPAPRFNSKIIINKSAGNIEKLFPQNIDEWLCVCVWVHKFSQFTCVCACAWRECVPVACIDLLYATQHICAPNSKTFGWHGDESGSGVGRTDEWCVLRVIFALVLPLLYWLTGEFVVRARWWYKINTSALVGGWIVGTSAAYPICYSATKNDIYGWEQEQRRIIIYFCAVFVYTVGWCVYRVREMLPSATTVRWRVCICVLRPASRSTRPTLPRTHTINLILFTIIAPSGSRFINITYRIYGVQ